MRVCVCVPGYCANFTQFSAFYAKFCRCKFTQIYAIKSFSRIGLAESMERGQRGAIARVCVCVDLMSGLIGNTLIFKHTHTHTHTHQLHILSVRQTETFYASAPQIFFGIKYLSCTVVSKEG